MYTTPFSTIDEALPHALSIVEQIKIHVNTPSDHIGSYLHIPQPKSHLFHLLKPKQQNFFLAVKGHKKMLEIGTHKAHSIILALLSNPTLSITTIDIAVEPALSSLKAIMPFFPKASIRFLNKASPKILYDIEEKFDIFHIDGNHNIETVLTEWAICRTLKEKNVSYKVVIDDYLETKDIEKYRYFIERDIKFQCIKKSPYSSAVFVYKD